MKIDIRADIVGNAWRAGLDQRYYSTSCPVSSGMGDRPGMQRAIGL